MRVARRVKSLSLETRQKPPNSRVCSKSIASMMSALSLAFLPTVLRNCWTGWIACSSNTVRQPCRFDVVKSPYTRLTLAVPSDATSERISPITVADALSASMRTARRREFVRHPIRSSAISDGLPSGTHQTDDTCSLASVIPRERVCLEIELDQRGASFLRSFLRMRDFPNAINNIPHPEERPEGASRRTHRGSAADVARVPSVRSAPLARRLSSNNRSAPTRQERFQRKLVLGLME